MKKAIKNKELKKKINTKNERAKKDYKRLKNLRKPSQTINEMLIDMFFYKISEISNAYKR